MRSSWVGRSAVAACLAASPMVAQAPAGSPERPAASQLRIDIGARLQYDVVGWRANGFQRDDVGSLASGTEVRRGRAKVTVVWSDRIALRVQYDFSQAEFKSVYLESRNLPVNLKLGHFKEPFGFEKLTSSRNILFLERSVADVFTPSFNTGVMASGHVAERFRLSVGAFWQTDGPEWKAGHGRLNVTGRVSATPVWRETTNTLVHVGASVSRRHQDEDVGLRFRERPEVHLAPRFVNTGHFPASGEWRFGVEGALIKGPWTVHAEYLGSRVETSDATRPVFSGMYASVGYWLTGDTRPYDGEDGDFRGIKPRGSVPHGIGAWELVARVSHLDLTDGPVTGGTLTNVTGGLNWHPAKTIRFMANVVYTVLDRSDDALAVLFRTQFAL